MCIVVVSGAAVVVAEDGFVEAGVWLWGVGLLDAGSLRRALGVVAVGTACLAGLTLAARALDTSEASWAE